MPITQPAEPLPEPTSNEYFPIQRRDWRQLREKITALREPPTYLAGVTWLTAGITCSAAITLVLWLRVDSVLPSKARMHYSYTTPMLLITAIAGLIITVFSWVAGGEVRKLRKTTFEEILVSMDSIYRPYSHVGISSARKGKRGFSNFVRFYAKSRRG